MKKIFILPILIAPIVANATLSTAEIDDNDRVYPVTASYVKEAYNTTANELNNKRVQVLATWDSNTTTQVTLTEAYTPGHQGGGEGK